MNIDNIDDILIKHLKENQAYLSSNQRFAVKAAIKEICIELLEKAANNAKLTEFAQEFLQEGAGEAIDKESITNTINQIQGL